MRRTPWPGLPDATAPGTSVSLGAVRRRLRTVVDQDEASRRHRWSLHQTRHHHPKAETRSVSGARLSAPR